MARPRKGAHSPWLPGRIWRATHPMFNPSLLKATTAFTRIMQMKQASNGTSPIVVQPPRRVNACRPSNSNSPSNQPHWLLQPRIAARQVGRRRRPDQSRRQDGGLGALDSEERRHDGHRQGGDRGRHLSRRRFPAEVRHLHPSARPRGLPKHLPAADQPTGLSTCLTARPGRYVHAPVREEVAHVRRAALRRVTASGAAPPPRPPSSSQPRPTSLCARPLRYRRSKAQHAQCSL